MLDTAPTHRRQAESISYCYEDFIRSVIHRRTFITYLGGRFFLKSKNIVFVLSLIVHTHLWYTEPSLGFLSA